MRYVYYGIHQNSPRYFYIGTTGRARLVSRHDLAPASEAAAAAAAAAANVPGVPGMQQCHTQSRRGSSSSQPQSPTAAAAEVEPAG